MVATSPQIQVHASFPRTVALGADIDVDPTNWYWVHCLTIPLETLHTLQFSQKSYKWIRYAIGVVAGSEGDLSSSPDSLNVVDYDADLPAESTFLYYHTNDEEKRRMFPTDPNIGRKNVTDSVATTRRSRFREDVVERDGVCVLSGAGLRYCDAVHLLAHYKGDSVCYSYSQSVLAHHRNGGSTFRLILSVAVETQLRPTLWRTLTTFGTASSWTTIFTGHWVNMLHS
jgi:hypothetical protein